WIALPGDARHWPVQVRLDGQPAVVLGRDDQPMVRVSPGDHRLQGRLPWSARPSRLHVPEAIGLVELTLDGKPVARLQCDGDELTLGEAAAAQRVADALSLRVDRRLADGLPAVLETRLRFDVTGSARELVLGPVLPGGFVAIALGGELPARMESDGRLRVQLKPGRWIVTLDARASAPLARVAITLPPAPWPRQEIWSYADDPDLRGSHAEGQATDAAQAGVPEDWRQLPAFVMDGQATLTVQPGERGAGRQDRLRLSRRLWLDFDGKGLAVDDRLQGEVHRQRLEVGAPWQLQRAGQDGDPLLVSHGKDGRSGVEVRSEQLDLAAGLRAPSTGALPATGWNVPLERIDATLQLPPGYRLLGAPGADSSPDSWVARWSLLDVFGVALIALLAGRLLGWPWALLAAGFWRWRSTSRARRAGRWHCCSRSRCCCGRCRTGACGAPPTSPPWPHSYSRRCGRCRSWRRSFNTRCIRSSSPRLIALNSRRGGWIRGTTFNLPDLLLRQRPPRQRHRYRKRRKRWEA
ncbi:MAG: hypothetical protein HOQ10_04290, partial [Frateuria sp.]|nr:hypothetical protein [Frateuria sp.]